MSVPDVYKWAGEPADIGDQLSCLTASDGYVVQRATFRVPTREDYRTALTVSGLLHSETALEDEPELVAGVQAHWHAHGYNACVFAENLSATREDSGWETYVLAAAEEPTGIADTIASICFERLPVPEVQVVSVLMPRLDNARDVVNVLRRLGSLPAWRLDIDRVSDEAGEAVLLGLRAKVELDHWAEVLGFGRFTGQANTRLAPFTELAIRAKEPSRPRRNQRAYMADIEVGISKIDFASWWHETEEARAARLGSDGDRRGKARVTFALDARTWEGTSDDG